MTEILPAAFDEWSVTDNTVNHEQSIPHTRQDYVRHARRFAAFLKRPPDTATLEQAIQLGARSLGGVQLAIQRDDFNRRALELRQVRFSGSHP